MMAGSFPTLGAEYFGGEAGEDTLKLCHALLGLTEDGGALGHCRAAVNLFADLSVLFETPSCD